MNHIHSYQVNSYKVPLRDVCDVKSREWRKLMKKDTKVTQQQSQPFMLEETWSKKEQDRSSCWLLLVLILFTLNIISYSYSNPAEYYLVLFALNIINLIQLWVAGEGSTIEWSYFPRKIVREKRLSFRGHKDLSYWTKSGPMSRKLVPRKFLWEWSKGEYLSITK